MPQPPADWIPLDDRTPLETAAQGFVYRSEGFAEDLAAAPAPAPAGRRERWRVRAVLGVLRGHAAADALGASGR